MSNRKAVFAAKAACVLSVIPVLIYAHEYGPDPAFTGAPGDNKTACIQAACHVGTVNSGTGKVVINTPSNTYTPGVKQHITVTVSDPAQKVAGFELTARVAGQTANFTQPGLFTPTDNLTQAICLDSSFAPCPAAFPLQYIEHNITGYQASKGPASYTYQFDWTPPAVAVGNITLYAAGNASNGSLSPSAGKVYTSNVTLTPAAAGGPVPTISATGGVVNGATFLPGTISPSTYITIYGTNLTTTTPGRLWAGTDFGKNGSLTTLPTSLDGTSVSVNGKAAYIEYISATQINAITPADTATGSVNVTVTSNGQTSTPAAVTMQNSSPGLFTFDNKYVAAGDAITGAFIGKTGLFASAPSLTTPAKPGELITLYGTGFGPTATTSPGIVTDKVYNLTPLPTFSVGGTSVTPGFAGLAPPFAQVYQFNITIPANAPDGDLQIFAQSGGVSTPNSAACCFLTVKK